MNQVGETIGKMRQNKNMTQEELATRLGVTSQAISRWERGNSLPDISLVKGICEVLSVSANTLFGMETENKGGEHNDLNVDMEIPGNLFAEPLVLEFGSALIPAVTEGLNTNYLNQCRKELVRETGILIPMVRLRDNVGLDDDEVCILSYDKAIWRGKISSQENAYQCMMQQLKATCRENYGTILNKQCVMSLVYCLREQYPGVVEGLVPEKISYLQLKKRLLEVLKEKGNIRDLIHILEEMEEEYEKVNN